ncbi:uncharacterized protein LOC131237241 [Magnolia sinica]|uniref:uncharacterized protein LOC131237241 n=1 Tax=Magnolia sinica TaxID=86752 RepID=UPI002658E802|nr:uncharacterized protein LOC131237241 [Magnolia sinica]
MHEFSTVDGFMDVNESLGEMIKYIANEPSVGLFYVQQHTQNAVPNLIHIKDRIVENSREITLHTEDLEDSIAMVRSMKDCGITIADEMNKDIKRSLLMMSASQPKKGLIQNPSLGFQMGRSSSWGAAGFSFNAGRAQQDGGSSGGYLSTVLNSAKQRAASLRWSQLDASPLGDPKGERLISFSTPPVSVVAAEVISTRTDMEADELPLSSHMVDEHFDLPTIIDESSSAHDPSPMLENYEKYRSDQEAKLAEWLEGIENRSGSVDTSRVNVS